MDCSESQRNLPRHGNQHVRGGEALNSAGESHATRLERGEAASRLRVLVLGSAAGGGFPQWNCNCVNCARYWAGDPAYPARSQSSIAVSADGAGQDRASWALINASPDLRAQILDARALRPRDGLRHSPIRSVLLTNGDLDHIAGLLTLREKQDFTLFATGELMTVLDQNPVFQALDPAHVRRTTVRLDTPFELAPGLGATLFAAPGKIPLFMEDDGPLDLAREGGFTVGVALEAGGRRAYYLPGCARMTEALAARLEGADLVLFDGTVFHDDDMIRAGVGRKTGARMGHLAMSGPDGSLAAFAGLGVRRKVYVHINNTNPALRPDSAERREIETAGWELAHDGMEISP